MIPVVCTHTMAEDDVAAWLAEHGLAIDEVVDAVVRIGYPGRHGHPAWLDVTFYKLNGNGERYADHTGEHVVATGRASVPLRSWPRLTPALDGLTAARVEAAP